MKATHLSAAVMVLILEGCTTAPLRPPEIPQGKGEWGPRSCGLRCRITMDRHTYCLGDVVKVLIEVRNDADEPTAIGKEPLFEVDGNMVCQPAEVIATATQGDFFCTTVRRFPKGEGGKARVAVIAPGQTYSELVESTPWGPVYGSIRSEAGSGAMQFQATLVQCVSEELKRQAIQSNVVTFEVSKGMH